MRSSNVSVPCRFELRPSRWLIGVMLAMSALAPLSVWASEMPRWAAWPLASFAAVAGLRLAWRERGLPVRNVVIDASSDALIDGMAVDDFRIDWRGPLVFLSWRDADGKVHRRSLWPDALGPSLRRELRLAVGKGNAVRSPDSMAP